MVSKRGKVNSSSKKNNSNKDTYKNSSDKEFELVPEKKFHELESKVNEIQKSPFVFDDQVKDMGHLLHSVNSSLSSLMGILSLIKDETSFEEKENNIIKKQLKPFIKEVNSIKEQNDVMTHSMINIIERLNDIQSKLDVLQENSLPYASDIVNPNLPPLDGGATPPVEQSNFSQNNNNIDSKNMLPPQMDSLPSMPGLDNLPPLENHKEKKKFNLFHK